MIAKQKLSAIYPDRSFVAAGGLLSYGTNYREVFYGTARALGLTIPAPLLLRADQAIE